MRTDSHTHDYTVTEEEDQWPGKVLSCHTVPRVRAKFSPDVESRVLFACKRGCAFCWGFNKDASIKEGQLAHIDRNRNNNAESNAAFLCLPHHNAYDSKPSQSKRLTKSELLRYSASLSKYQKKALVWTDTQVHTTSQSKRRTHNVSLDLYKARIPTYHTTVQFLRTVAKDLRPSIQDILKFARDTEEALFLFDDAIADFLTLLFRKALRLNAIEAMRDAYRPTTLVS